MHRHLSCLTLVLTLSHTLIPSLVMAFPGNNQAFDCYRKVDNSFSFGSPTDVSNTAILCTPNPDLAPSPAPPQTTTSSSSASDIAAGLAIGLGAAALGRAIFDNDDNVTVYSPGYSRGTPYNGYNYYRRGNNYYYHNRSGTVRRGVTR